MSKAVTVLRASLLVGTSVLLFPPLALAAEPTASVALDQVQVRASQQGQMASAGAEQALTPGSVSLVDGNKLRQTPVNNLDDALRYVPGVVAESETGGAESFLSVRGSNLDAIGYDNSGIKLFQDGLPVTTADGNNHNRLLDASEVRYLDVANGSNALTYGASTLGGAINSVSRTALNSDPRELFIGGGSHGQVTGRASLGGVAGDLDGMLSVGRSLWDGYRDHSQEDTNHVNANLGWRLSDSLDLRFFASHLDSEQQLAGALTRAQVDADPDQANPGNLNGNYQKNVKTDRFATKGNWRIDGNSYLEFGVSYEQQSLYHPIVESPFFSLLVDTDQKTTGGMVRYHLQQGDHDWLAGVNLAYTTDEGGNYGSSHGKRTTKNDAVDTDASDNEIFLLDRWAFASAWTLVYGGQGVFTNRHDDTIKGVNSATPIARDATDRYDAFNPRVGLIYHLNPRSQAYASVSRLYEAPNNFALDNARSGSGDPDASLDAMHGVSYETGLRGQSGGASDQPGWRWALSFYYARLSDEILSVETAPGSGQYLSGNVDSTIHAGAELQLGASLPVAAGWLEPQVSATWNHFAFDDDAAYGNNDLPGAPAYLIHGELMYRHAGGFFVGPTFDFSGDRYVDFANSYRVSGYELLGLRAGYHQPRWDVYVGARNLLDRDYIASASAQDVASATDAVLYPGEPRSVYAGFRVNY